MHSVSSAELVAALRQAGLTDVDGTNGRRAQYSSDASLYRLVPAAVAWPRSADEVAAALSTCTQLGVPVVPRGAGTSIAGNAIGTGLVLDLSRHMQRIIAIDPEAQTAVVEPGVVLDDLQRAASRAGLRFGPEPSTHDRCTIGGMIGNNACGSRALRYGRTSDNTLALEVIAGDGERLKLGSGVPTQEPDVLVRLRAAVQSRLAVIRTELGTFGRQASGFGLEHLLPERGFDVARALVGTEGTCAITVGATLRLVKPPAATALLVLGYPDMPSAADAAPAIALHEPTAVEGLDARIVRAARDASAGRGFPDLPRGAGWLMVELGGASHADIQSTVPLIIADGQPVDWKLVEDRREVEALWRIREDGAGLAARPSRGWRAHAGWEDAAVPPARLGAYLREFDALLAEHALEGVPYGHFGDGCVHVRISFPIGDERLADHGASVFRRFVVDAARLVASYGGSMSGEHGDGRARSELLPIMYSTEALEAFAAVKAVFDPRDLLNPGVVVRPDKLDADLRLINAPPIRTGSGHTLALRYTDDDGDFTRAVHRCTGVGRCRADLTGTGGVMCPSYLATRDERDSTRGRARVLQEMTNGTLVRGWRAPEVLDVLDLCLSCKGCLSDCPTGVDMASYKAEVLHQAYRRRLRPASHYALGWLPRWARLAGLAPNLTNRALRSRLAAVGRRLAGVDQRRPLPAFATETFMEWFDRQPSTGGAPVLLWVDTFTNYFRPQVGAAAVRVLNRAGYQVRVLERTACCGLTWISTGQLDAAKRILSRSAEQLAAAVDATTPIVALEPSCAAVWRGDAAHLFGAGSRPALIGARVQTLAEVLGASGDWSADLGGVEILSQVHCHHHAVMGWDRDQQLLEASGAKVVKLSGCCGMAGNFGVERGHYDVSVAVAETSLLPALRSHKERVVMADGFSCQLQIQQLADRSSLHLAEILDRFGDRASESSR